MKMKDFEKLKKMMERTFSENDHEALASIRAANRILAAEGLTWDRIFNRTVTVVNEVEEAPAPSPAPSSGKQEDENLIAEAEQRAPTNGFVHKMRAHWDEKGWFSKGQRDTLREIIEGTSRW